jgi:hypothetical protein
MKDVTLTARKITGLFIILLGLTTASGCSVQQASLASSTSLVEIKYEQPEGDSPIGIRTTIAGTGERVTVNDYDFADETGRTSIVTSRLQNTLIVARSKRHDVAYGIVNILEDGQTYSVESLTGTTGTTSISPPVLTKKTKGEALIIFVSKDWPYGEVTDVKIVGDETHFEPDQGMHQLYDDGTNGDFFANDGVWSLRMTHSSVDYGYGFVINDHRDRVYRDPHEEHSRIYVDKQGFEVYRSVIAVVQDED